MGVAGVEDLSTGIRIGQQVVAASEVGHGDDCSERNQNGGVDRLMCRARVPDPEGLSDRGDPPGPKQDDDRHSHQADAPISEELRREDHRTTP